MSVVDRDCEQRQLPGLLQDSKTALDSRQRKLPAGSLGSVRLFLNAWLGMSELFSQLTVWKLTGHDEVMDSGAAKFNSRLLGNGTQGRECSLIVTTSSSGTGRDQNWRQLPALLQDSKNAMG